jgi:hypothetical protein
MKLLATFLRVLYFPFPVCAPLEGTSVANRFDLLANRGNMAGPAAIVSCSRGVRCAGRTESQIPLAHESDFRSRTWRMVRQHRQSLGDRTISDCRPQVRASIRHSTFPFAAARSARIASATTTSRIPQPEACSTSLRSIRFLMGQREIVVWESWRDLAPLRSRLSCPKLSISRNRCGCALKARSQIYSIIRTSRHRQRT